MNENHIAIHNELSEPDMTARAAQIANQTALDALRALPLQTLEIKRICKMLEVHLRYPSVGVALPIPPGERENDVPLEAVELLRNHVPDGTQDFTISCVRDSYLMMLVGGYDSPLGKRREVTFETVPHLAVWHPCSAPPTVSGHYILEGKYGDFHSIWESAILPVWYHADENEWEAIDGGFSIARQWCEIPFIPVVWEAAKAHSAASLNRTRTTVKAASIERENDVPMTRAEEFEETAQRR